MRIQLHFKPFALRIKSPWKRLIFICLALFATVALHSQNITQLWYWFETGSQSNSTHVSFTPTPDLVMNFNIPATLTPGLHTLNIEGMDEGCRWSQVNHLLFCYEQFTHPQITRVEYFIGNDPGTGMGTPVSFISGTNVSDIIIPLNSYTIERGIHHLCVRAMDQNGKWSMTNDRVILCEPVTQNIVEAEYFIDTDPGTGSGIPVSFVPGIDVTNLVFNLDLNVLPVGAHHLGIRAKDEFGRWSITSDKVILCERNTIPDIVKAEYFIDTDPGTGLGINIPVTPASNIGNLVFMIDMIPFTAGNHNLFLRAKDSYGKWSLTNMAQFEVIHLTHNLNLVVFLEGLYAGNAIMTQANDDMGPHFGTGIADHVTVELHYDYSPYELAYSFDNVELNTDGTLTVPAIPAGASSSFYIVVKHRNSIETWSMAPVSFAGAGPVIYDFSTAASQAYGNNLKPMGGVYVIFGADPDQSGTVDGSDMVLIDNASQPPVLHGYFPEDLDGSGTVDGTDMVMIDNNSQPPVVSVKKP